MDVAEILEKAADLIEPEGAWMQGDFARDRAGNEWNVAGEGSFSEWDASCFCLFGAVARAAGADEPDGHFETDHILVRVIGVPNTYAAAQWNDDPERTQAEVVAKLREAAALAREQAAA